MGFRNLIEGLLNRKPTRIPKIFNKLSFYLRKLSTSPLKVFMVGILAGILLLPCTSTPYLVILSLLSTLENLYEGLILLILYNIVMVIPLLILTLGVYLLRL